MNKKLLGRDNPKDSTKDNLPCHPEFGDIVRCYQSKCSEYYIQGSISGYSRSSKYPDQYWVLYVNRNGQQVTGFFDSDLIEIFMTKDELEKSKKRIEGKIA